jgi:hypothetical protein
LLQPFLNAAFPDRPCHKIVNQLKYNTLTSAAQAGKIFNCSLKATDKTLIGDELAVGTAGTLCLADELVLKKRKRLALPG